MNFLDHTVISSKPVFQTAKRRPRIDADDLEIGLDEDDGGSIHSVQFEIPTDADAYNTVIPVNLRTDDGRIYSLDAGTRAITFGVDSMTMDLFDLVQTGDGVTGRDAQVDRWDQTQRTGMSRRTVSVVGDESDLEFEILGDQVKTFRYTGSGGT